MPPLGLAYLAGELQAQGRHVEILDAYALGWSWPRFTRELADRRPDVLGLSAMTPVADTAWRAAQAARPHVGRIVLGGPHPTAVREAALAECPAIDELVLGEGEEVVGPYLDWLDDPAKPPPPGVMTRGQPFRPHEPTRPIGELAWPARELLPMGSYRYLMATRPGFATMLTSRGCPFRCSFCDKSVSGSRWRAREADDVVDELAWLASRGVGFVNFYDDNFTLSRRRVHAICAAIQRRGLDIAWKAEARVDGVDLEALKAMRAAGCRVVAYGVESANPDTLTLLRKDVKVDKVRRAFALTREAGLRSVAYMILGAPGESQAEVRRSLDFVHEIRADYVQFSSLVALPNTPLYASHGAWAEHARLDVKNPVDADHHRVTVSDLPPDELADLLRQAWRGFYLRPRPMARLARDAWRSGSLVEAARLGGAMARWSVA